MKIYKCELEFGYANSKGHFYPMEKISRYEWGKRGIKSVAKTIESIYGPSLGSHEWVEFHKQFGQKTYAGECIHTYRINRIECVA